MKNLFRTLRLFEKILLLIFLAGCSLPIRSEDMPAILDKLSQSNASACVVTGVSGGGGAMPIAPVPVPGGGWGSASFTFCRSNEPGSEIKVTDAGIKIKHGFAIAAEIQQRIEVLETAVKYLLQRLIDPDKPKAGLPAAMQAGTTL